MVSGWKGFVSLTKGLEAAALVVEAIKITKKQSKKALDLGAGAGSNANALAKAGFTVDAVDISPESVKELTRLAREFRINVFQKDIYKFIIPPESYDIIVAWNSLPFLDKDKAQEVFRRIQSGLRPGGVVVISIFGPDDQWSKNQTMSFFSTRELKHFWSTLNFVKIIESKRMGITANGDEKFWHIIRCIAKCKLKNVKLQVPALYSAPHPGQHRSCNYTDPSRANPIAASLLES